jgi:hypothetical protein
MLSEFGENAADYLWRPGERFVHADGCGLRTGKAVADGIEAGDRCRVS